MTQHSLAALRAALDDAPAGDKPRESNFGNYYPFWEMEPGQKAVVRFLPDKDKKNPRQFLLEQVFHNLTVNGKKTKVPCMSQYGEDCPVCKISQDYYKVEGKESANGKKYWRKKQYLTQAIIVEDPLPPNKESGETHAGKVRYLPLGFQIYNIIKESLADEDLFPEDAQSPHEFAGGRDFTIKVTKQGEYKSYATGTKFSNRERDLTDDELAVAEEGMVELKSLLPKNPGVDVVQAKLNSDINGEEYTDGRQSRAKPAPAAASTVEDEEDAAPVAASKPAARPAPTTSVSDDEEGSSDVDDMLAQIRARRSGK